MCPTAPTAVRRMDSGGRDGVRRKVREPARRLSRPGGESGQYAGQATLEPFVGVQVRGLVHHSLQVWKVAAVQSLLQVWGHSGAPLRFGEPGTPLGPFLGQLSGGCTQY